MEISVKCLSHENTDPLTVRKLNQKPAIFRALTQPTKRPHDQNTVIAIHESELQYVTN